MYKLKTVGRSGEVEERCQEKPVKYALMTNTSKEATRAWRLDGISLVCKKL